MKLPVIYWRDLAIALDDVPQKDLATTADVRKCVGTVEQIRKSIVKPMEEFEVVQKKINAKRVEVDAKLAKFPENEENTKKREEIIEKANADVMPIIKEREKVDAKYEKEEAEIDLDPNYKEFVKGIWEDHVRPRYMVKDAMLKVAEAFGIE